MADMKDILGKKVDKNQDAEIYEVDGMCGYVDAAGDFCFYPYVHGYYYPKRKKLSLECSMGHHTELDWDASG